MNEKNAKIIALIIAWFIGVFTLIAVCNA